MWDFIHLFCTSFLMISVCQPLIFLPVTFEGDEVIINKSQLFDEDNAQGNKSQKIDETTIQANISQKFDENEVFKKPNFPNPVSTTTTTFITDNENVKAIENLQEKLKTRRGIWNMEEDNIDMVPRSNDAILNQLPRPDSTSDKDDNLKLKIKSLVEQTQYDTNRKVKTLDVIKDFYSTYPAYRVGFLLSMLQKTKQTLDELFNVAMRHRDDWKALEQLKVFEMIIHTNVDASQLIRQIVDYHITHLNTTSTAPNLFLLK